MIQRIPRHNNIKETVAEWEFFGARLDVVDLLFKFVDRKSVPAVSLQKIVDAVSFTILENREGRKRTRADNSDLQPNKSIGFQAQIAEIRGVFTLHGRESEQRVFSEVETCFFLWIFRAR